jgi:hypothetical protein
MRGVFQRLLLIVVLFASAAHGHVGSPDVFYDGKAGPYRLFVTVRTPRMIPGVAQIEVRVLEGTVTGIDIVTLRVVGEGSENAPPPDRMTVSSSDPQLFAGKLWLMESGSWQVRMDVSGVKGTAQMAVPVAAFAQRSLRMQRAMGAFLSILMLVLVFSAISIFGAAARESQLEPGAAPQSENQRKARMIMVGAAVAVAAILFLGNLWWDSKAQENSTNMIYRPPPMQASISGNQLQLKVGFSEWHDRRKRMQLVDLVPDHGHLMHLFLLRLPEMDRFYHLHPDMSADTFVHQLTSEAPGRYVLFADIVRESGFPDTMTTQIAVPDGAESSTPLTGDDSGASAPILSSTSPRSISSLSDGCQVAWVGDTSLYATKPALLRFRIEDSRGNPIGDLQPYMGMAGHLVIVRRDLSVFSHIHPTGSVPMAAVALLEKKTPQAHESMVGMEQNQSIPPEITFPYGFPQPGDYRLFLQVRRGGQVQTAVFDVTVKS